MLFVQSGNTEQTIANSARGTEYRFARFDYRTTYFSLGSGPGYWSFKRKYTTGFRLEIIS